MKKLQNDFTTPEQSKRLLELGVPAKSADCYYLAIGYNPKKYGYGDFPYFITTNKADLAYLTDPNIPCWSVGRLIEICKICGSYELAKEIYGRALMYLNTVDGCICEMSYEISKGNLDFSKLED